MLKRYVIDICGEDEFQRQAKQAQEVMQEEEKRKAEIELVDLTMLDSIWTILTRSNDLSFEDFLKVPMQVFDAQLWKPGNSKVIQKTSEFLERDYINFGGMDGFKNRFAANNILGLAQLRRLSVCDMQMSFSGLARTQKGEEDSLVVPRSDVRKNLGVLNMEQPQAFTYRLGSLCHIDTLIGACWWSDFGGSGCRSAAWERYLKQKDSATQNCIAPPASRALCAGRSG